MRHGTYPSVAVEWSGRVCLRRTRSEMTAFRQPDLISLHVGLFSDISQRAKKSLPSTTMQMLTPSSTLWPDRSVQ